MKSKENLYETLGVDPKASTENIRRAYRKRAMKHHPDRKHGDVKKFQALQLAYDVLSDPERREKYDRVGDVDENLDSPAQRARRELCGLLVQATESIAINDDPKISSPLEAVTLYLADEVTKLQASLKKGSKIIASLRVAAERLQRKDGGNNLAAAALLARAAEQEVSVHKIESRLQQIADMRLELELYTYRKDQPQTQTGWIVMSLDVR